jgi:ketosteroid isomerase-like protein
MGAGLWLRVLGLAALGTPLATGSCTKKAVAPATPVPGAIDAAPPAVAAPATPPARQALDEWLDAQNRGSFTAYQGLYADDFAAIMHAGNRTRTVARAPWLSEQKRRFRKPMNVTIRALDLAASNDGVQACFDEISESGSRHEETQKRVTFVRLDGGWRIAKEEVLATKVDAAKGTAMSSMAFVFVWGNAPVLMSDADDGWTVGRPRMLEGADVAVKAVDEKRLPREILMWKDEKLILIDERLQECEATVLGFQMMTVSEYELDNIEVKGKRTQAALAAEVWKGKHLLVARTSPTSDRCRDMVLARPARLPKLEIHPFTEAEKALAKSASTRLEALPDVVEWAARAKVEHPDWEASPTVSVANLGKAGSLISAAVSGDACGGVGYFAVAIWHTSGRPGKDAWHMMRPPQDGDQLEPLLAFDLDGDGTMEILFRDDEPVRFGLLRWNGKDYAVSEKLEIPYDGCHC